MYLTTWNRKHETGEEIKLLTIFSRNLLLEQISQNPIQPDFEYFQAWGIRNFYGQSVPVADHPYNKNFLPYI